jgi:hypothetical protein
MKLIEQQLATPKANKQKQMPAMARAPRIGDATAPMLTESIEVIDQQIASPVTYKRKRVPAKRVKKTETAITIDQECPASLTSQRKQTLAKELPIQQSSGSGEISTVIAQIMSLGQELSKENDVKEQLELWEEKSRIWNKKLVDAMRYAEGTKRHWRVRTANV